MPGVEGTFVRAETRHQLKQDRFSQATMDAADATVQWSVEHQSKLIVGGIILAVVLAAGFGGWYYFEPAGPESQRPAEPGCAHPGYPCAPRERRRKLIFPACFRPGTGTEAHKQFQAIVDQYPHTHTAEFARYFLALTASELGDNAAAERDLKAVASTRNKDLAALAKLALAAVYRDTNRTKEAIDMYNQLADKPTTAVGKTTAQMELAATYQADQQPPKPSESTSRSRRKIPPLKWRNSRPRNCRKSSRTGLQTSDQNSYFHSLVSRAE